MTRDVSIRDDVSEDAPSALNRRTVLGALSLGLVAAACSLPGGDNSADGEDSDSSSGLAVGDEVRVALPARDDTGRKPFDQLNITSIDEMGEEMPGGGSVPQVGQVVRSNPAPAASSSATPAASAPSSGSAVAPVVPSAPSAASPPNPNLGAAPDAPFVPVSLGDRVQGDFILTRLTSGITDERRASIAALGTAGFITDQLAKSTPDPAVEAQIAAFSTFGVTKQQAFAATAAGKDNEVARIELTLAEYLRKTQSESQLFEQMASCWMDMFNVTFLEGPYEGLLPDYEQNVIRANCMGDFSAMLQASAKHPAMLLFLDGAINDANDPGGINENYGREILELHSLGKEPAQIYDEDDVRAAAFIMCGRTVDMNEASPTYLEYQFDPARASADAHTVVDFVGVANGGEAGGDALVDYLATHPQTAQYVSIRMAKKFVQDAPPQALIDVMAAAYLASGTDIIETFLAMVNHPEFLVSDGLKLRDPNQSMMAALVACNTPIPTDPASPDALALRTAMDELGHESWTEGTPFGFEDDALAYNKTNIRGNIMNKTAAVATGKLSATLAPDVARLRGAAATAGELVADLARRLGLGTISAEHSAVALTAIGAAAGDAAAGLSDTQVQDLASYLMTHPLFQIR